MKLEVLREILEDCWPDRSSEGQCYITTLIVQDFMGGYIVRYQGEKDRSYLSHYWNRLWSGREIDLTSDQYGGDGINPVFEKESRYPTREEKLYPYPQTEERYNQLRKKVIERILDIDEKVCLVCGTNYSSYLRPFTRKGLKLHLMNRHKIKKKGWNKRRS